MIVPPWTEKADALVRVVHPDFAARKLHLPLEVILARRDELGLPPVEEQFRKFSRPKLRRGDE